jgi:hypothetical protein
VALIELELIADPDFLVDEGVNYLEQNLAGFRSRAGSVEQILLEANAQIGTEIVEQAAQIDPLIFSYLGEDLFGIPARGATAASSTAAVTWATDVVTATLLPAGSLIAVPSPGGEPVAFQTNTDLNAPAGGGVQSVTVTALEEGEAGNGCFGQAEPIDIVDGIDRIDVAVASTGGTEDETTDEYLARLAEALTILAPRPILPADFATLARQVAGVERAQTIDLYQPSTGQSGYGTPRGASPVTNVPRCATVVITAAAGAAPSNPLMQEVFNLLDGAREVNFLAYVIPPVYTAIDVVATVTAYPGYSAVEVEAAAEAELAAWLSPDTWGAPPGSLSATGEATGGAWVFDNTVRLYEAVEHLNRAAGVHYVNAVQIRQAGGSFGTADVPLGTPVGLPTAGSLSVTVNLP